MTSSSNEKSNDTAGAHRRRFVALAAVFVGAQLLIVALCWMALIMVDVAREYTTAEAAYFEGAEDGGHSAAPFRRHR